MADNTQYTVTARKWRPLTFKDVVGQDHITRTLKNSIRTGRVHHGAIYTGSRGVGKTTTARIFARALNCPNAPELDYEPCNNCESCKSILTGSSLNVLEMDGASNNSVDDIRNLRESAKYAPPNKGYKVYIIDEVHMLSTAAFNALLKLLEEPPEHLIFVFATTEPHKIPATIISRTQRYDFRRMEIKDVVSQLAMIAEKEGITIKEKSLVTIAKKGDGSMRDSQSIFDQVVAFCGKEIKYDDMKQSLYLIDEGLFFEIEEDISNGKIAEIFVIVKEIVENGYDISDTLNGLIEHYRNLYTVSITGSTDMIVSDNDTLELYQKRADSYSQQYLLTIIGRLNQIELELKTSSIPQHRFEMSLVALANIPLEFDLSGLLAGQPEITKSDTKTDQLESPDSQKKKLDYDSRSATLAPKIEPPTDKNTKPAEVQQQQTKPSFAKPISQTRVETTSEHINDNSSKAPDAAKDFSQNPEIRPQSPDQSTSNTSTTSNTSVPNKQETRDTSVNDNDPLKEIDNAMKNLFNAKKIR